jgi:hypothetical protein
MQIGNLRYYNYALTQGQIRSVFESGPPKFEMKDEADTAADKPAFLSAYNKIDLFNF